MNKRKAESPSTQHAAVYAEAHDEEVSIILAEMAESAGYAARSWHLAMRHVGSEPQRALRHLTDAEVRLDNHVRVELADALRTVRSLIKRLDAELPE